MPPSSSVIDILRPKNLTRVLPVNFGELAIIGLLVVLTLVSLTYPVVVSNTPIFFAEAFLFCLFCHTSFKQLCFVLLIIFSAIFLMNPFEMSPVALYGSILMQAVSLRFVAFKLQFGTITEGIILSYALVIPIFGIAFYLSHGDTSLVALQISRKIVEALVCIITFHLIQKTAVCINAFFDAPIPFFPSVISTKEFLQSMTSAACAGLLLIAVAFELTEVHSSWATSSIKAIDRIQEAHSEKMRSKIGHLLSDNSVIEFDTGNYGVSPSEERQLNQGVLEARLLQLPLQLNSDELNEKQYEIAETLSRLRPIASSFAVTQINYPNDSRWQFFSNYGQSGILLLSFKSKDDMTRFFSTEDIKISLTSSEFSASVHSRAETEPEFSTPKIRKFTIFEGDSVIIWAETDRYLGDQYLLSALRKGSSFISFATSSALGLPGPEWKFVTKTHAWPLISNQFLPMLYTTGFGFFCLSLFVLFFGAFVHHVMKPQAAYSQDYAAYIISLLSPEPNYKTPEIRRTILSEAVTAQQTLRLLSEEISEQKVVMQDTIGSYKHFFDEIPVGIMGIDDLGQRNFVNEALAGICRLSIVALDEIQDIAIKIPDTTQRASSESQVICGDGNVHQLDIFTVERQGKRGIKDGIWVIIADRTDEKLKDEQLAQASKLATLGQMSTEIAHELNQPLNVISLCQASISAHVSKQDTDKQAVLKKTARIKTAVDRASRIINHMRVYGRVDTGQLELVDAREAIKGALTMTEDQLRLLGIVVKAELPDSALLIMSDVTKLEQVIINLIGNSRDATLENAASPSILVSATAEDGKVTVIVEDNGGGVKEEELFKIFEPFWTTKLSGEGTGLGGSISYGVIKEMGGVIVADNIDGGLRVTISLKQYRGDLELCQSAAASAS